ncbi:DUF92 domain-containing protein [Paenibacillus sp. MBLB4367]|uniref:DUF92 domain-containing protein n=1 Tax=Paenibacillus sp. MBLB4367 TaxID=3384767 RepID=UPI0039080D6E
MQWAIGLAGSLAIAGAAYAKRSLSISGAAAAVVTGALLYGGGSPAWFGTLIAFFLSSSLLSKWKKAARGEAESGYEKGGRRDAGQVAANGGLALLLCAADRLWPDPLWLAAFVGALAAVNADTWATEIGGLSRSKPRSIFTGAPVPPGTSGGITLLGLAASACGGLFIGAAAYALLMATPADGRLAADAGVQAAGALPLLLAAFAGGMIGSLADSAIGAVWQRMNRCAVCGKEVERSVHCGQPAAHSRGLRWMGNDAVNALCSIAGSAAAACLWFLIS